MINMSMCSFFKISELPVLSVRILNKKSAAAGSSYCEIDDSPFIFQFHEIPCVHERIIRVHAGRFLKNPAICQAVYPQRQQYTLICL